MLGARLKQARKRDIGFLGLAALAIGVHAWSGAWVVWSVFSLLAACQLGQIATRWPPNSPAVARAAIVALVFAAGAFAAWEIHGGLDAPPKTDQDPWAAHVMVMALRTANAAVAAVLAEGARPVEKPRTTEPVPSDPSVAGSATAPPVPFKATLKLHVGKGGGASASVELETGGSKSPGSGSNLALTEKASTAKAPAGTRKTEAAGVGSSATEGPGGASAPPSSESETGGTAAPEEPAGKPAPALAAPGTSKAATEQSAPSTP